MSNSNAPTYQELWNEGIKYRERIRELEAGLWEIIDHTYESGSHVLTLRKMALKVLKEPEVSDE